VACLRCNRCYTPSATADLSRSKPRVSKIGDMNNIASFCIRQRAYSIVRRALSHHTKAITVPRVHKAKKHISDAFNKKCTLVRLLTSLLLLIESRMVKGYLVPLLSNAWFRHYYQGMGKLIYMCHLLAFSFL